MRLRQWFLVGSLLFTGWCFGVFTQSSFATPKTAAQAAAQAAATSNQYLQQLLTLLGSIVVSCLVIFFEFMKKTGRFQSKTDQHIEEIHKTLHEDKLAQKIIAMHEYVLNPLEVDQRAKSRGHVEKMLSAVPMIEATYALLRSPDPNSLPPLMVIRAQLQTTQVMVSDLVTVLKEWIQSEQKNEKAVQFLVENSIERLKNLEAIYSQILDLIDK